MEHFAGLDVSVKETSVCIVDGTGKIVREVKVASEPEALLPVLTNPSYHFKRIGLEAGPLIAMALQCSCRSGLAGDLCRDPAYESGLEGPDQQDGPQRCAGDGADNAADPPQAASVEGYLHRQLSARDWTHPEKVEAPYTVCIASASNLTGLVKSSVECRRTDDRGGRLRSYRQLPDHGRSDVDARNPARRHRPVPPDLPRGRAEAEHGIVRRGPAAARGRRQRSGPIQEKWRRPTPFALLLPRI